MKIIKEKLKNILKYNLLPEYEIESILPKLIYYIEKYEGKKESSVSVNSRTYLENNGSVLIITTDTLEIRIFNSDEDYLQYFCPLKKLNDVENKPRDQNLVINKLFDFDSEYKILVEEKLINLNGNFCNIINKLEKRDNILIFINKIFKTFFRTIFLLYLKNDQIDVSLNLSNIGLKTQTSNKIDNYLNNLDSIKILSFNFINSKYLKTPVDLNKIDNFLAKRYMFESFKNFRDSILIKLRECENFGYIIDELKEHFKFIDEILTDEYDTDKIIKGRTEYITVKSFKFLNIDDIIAIIKKKLI